MYHMSKLYNKEFARQKLSDNPYMYIYTWVVVKIMVPFWVLIIIRHLLFRVPEKGP